MTVRARTAPARPGSELVDVELDTVKAPEISAEGRGHTAGRVRRRAPTGRAQTSDRLDVYREEIRRAERLMRSHWRFEQASSPHTRTENNLAFEGLAKKVVQRGGIYVPRENLLLQREATYSLQRASHILCRLPKILKRHDYPTALEMVKRARANYIKANKSGSTTDTEALYMQLKGEEVLLALEDARRTRQYDKCVQIVEEAHHHFKLMAALLELKRDAPDFEVRKKGSLVGKYRAFVNPVKVVQGFAVEDGERLRTQALKCADEKDFKGSFQSIEDANKCFAWAALKSGTRSLQRLLEYIQRLEHAAKADELLKAVTAELVPVKQKDFQALLTRLADSERHFAAAKDDAGVQTVQWVRQAQDCCRKADIAWLRMADSLLSRNYTDACACLQQARAHLSPVATGLRFINDDIERIVQLVVHSRLEVQSTGRPQESARSPLSAGDRSALSVGDMVAEMALHDGTQLLQMSVAAADQEDLPAAELYVQASVKCFEWTANARQCPKQLLQMSLRTIEGDENDEAVLSDPAAISQGLQLVVRYGEVLRNLTTGPPRDVVEAACSAMQDVEAVRQRIDRQRRKAKADALLAQAQTAAATTPAPASADNGPASQTDIIETLDTAISLYHDLGSPHQMQEATELRSRLLGEASLRDIVRCLQTGQVERAVTLLGQSRAQCESLHDAAALQQLRRLDALASSVRGQELIRRARQLLDAKAFDDAVVVLEEAKAQLHRAGDEDVLSAYTHGHTPRTFVQDRVAQEAARSERSALEAVVQGHLDVARALAAEARRCYQWAGLDHHHLVTVDNAIAMCEAFQRSRTLEAEAQRVVVDDRQQAIALYSQAKVALTDCQAVYRRLVKRASDLLCISSADNGFDFHDYVLRLYRSSFDGGKIARLEALCNALRADIDLDGIGQLLTQGLTDTAEAVLDAAALAYKEGSGDQERLKKVGLMREVLRQRKLYAERIKAKDYDAATKQLRQLNFLLDELTTLPPATIKVASFSQEDPGAGQEQAVVLLSAVAAGEADKALAMERSRRGLFDEALHLCQQARKSFAWAAKAQGQALEEDSIGFEALETTIRKHQASAQGEKVLAQAKQSLTHNDFSGALVLLNDAVTAFTKAETTQKLKEAQMYVADTQGKQALASAHDLFKDEKYDDCLIQLNLADDYFKRSGNQASLTVAGRLRARIAATLAAAELPAAYASQDYDAAVTIIEKARTYFKDAGDEKSPLLREEPRERVRAVAIRDGDRLKQDALQALTRKHDLNLSRQLLQEAIRSFEWAGVSPLQSGVKAVEKDIEAFETRHNADQAMRSAVAMAAEGNLEAAVILIEEAVSSYRAVKIVQQLSDAQILATCWRGELELHTLGTLVEEGSVQKAEELVHDAETILNAASMLTNPDVEIWTKVVPAKLNLLRSLNAVLKLWATMCDLMAPGDPGASNADVTTICGQIVGKLEGLASMPELRSTGLHRVIPIDHLRQLIETVRTETDLNADNHRVQPQDDESQSIFSLYQGSEDGFVSERDHPAVAPRGSILDQQHLRPEARGQPGPSHSEEASEHTSPSESSAGYELSYDSAS